MKKYLEKNYKKLIIIFVIYLFTLPIFVIDTNYEITTPGMFNLVNNQIKIENDFNYTNNFYTTSVYVDNTHVSAFKLMIASLSKKNEIEKINYSYSHLSDRDYYYQGKISKLTSINDSIIASYEEAKKIDSSIYIDYSFIGYVVYYTAKDLKSLRISDIIIEAKTKDKTEYKTSSFEIYDLLVNNKVLDLKILRLKNQFANKNLKDQMLLDLNNYEKLELTLDRSSLTKDLGISVFKLYKINKTTPQLVVYDSNTFGNSGGLMQTLSLYYTLIKKKFPKNIKICGTGTIALEFDSSDKYENSKVGAIGGMVQKIYTANKDKAVDIFFVPNGITNSNERQNFNEAYSTYLSLNKPKFKLVDVKSLKEAIDFLEAI